MEKPHGHVKIIRRQQAVNNNNSNRAIYARKMGSCFFRILYTEQKIGSDISVLISVQNKLTSYRQDSWWHTPSQIYFQTPPTYLMWKIKTLDESLERGRMLDTWLYFVILLLLFASHWYLLNFVHRGFSSWKLITFIMYVSYMPKTWTSISTIWPNKGQRTDILKTYNIKLMIVVVVYHVTIVVTSSFLPTFSPIY